MPKKMLQSREIGHRDDRPPLFLLTSGQVDNIGDSVLRRSFLNSLRPSARLHLWAEVDGWGYFKDLQLQSEDTIYYTRGSWRKALLNFSAGQRVFYGGNAGEEQIHPRVCSYLLEAIFVLLVSLQGGAAFHCGYGIKKWREGWTGVYGILLHTFALVSWRDPVSRAWIGLGEVAPDWAFATGQSDSWLASSEAGLRRSYLTVSMRGDRPWPKPHWFATLRNLAERRRLKLRVVIQVRSDEERGMQLAEALGADFVGWHDLTHFEQETKLRDIYRSSLLTVSDRLHVLIIGLTEGAVPVGFVTGPTEKLARSFAGVGIDNIIFSQDAVTTESALEKIERILGRAPELFLALARGRRTLAGLTCRLRRLMNPALRPDCII